jgi:hypothetical protein
MRTWIEELTGTLNEYQDLKRQAEIEAEEICGLKRQAEMDHAVYHILICRRCGKVWPADQLAVCECGNQSFHGYRYTGGLLIA